MKTVLITNRYDSVWAQKIAHAAGFSLLGVVCTRFADGEIELDTSDFTSVKGAHAIIICTRVLSVHDVIMWLIFVTRALQVAQAQKITLFMPYTAYSRQREALQTILTVVASLGVSQLITIALHEPSWVQVSDVAVIDISLDALIVQWAQKKYPQGQVTIVAPDEGALERAQFFAQQLQAPLMVCAKERYGINKVRITQVQGTCQTPYALVVDDMIDTGSTIHDVARILRDQHKVDVIDVFAAHGLLSGNARDLLQQSVLRNIIITNSIEHDILPPKFQVVDISNFVTSKVLGVNGQKPTNAQ